MGKESQGAIGNISYRLDPKGDRCGGEDDSSLLAIAGGEINS
jgi:hypothetical protein